MSVSPTKEASPTKADKPTFTEKEERVLKAAWSCLKSPPEIDMEKLVIAAEFNTTKTASNTWGVIKKKLKDLNPQPAAEGEDGAATPTKANATPKKRGKKATAADDDEAGDDGESPTKKRKTPKKGKKTKAGADEDVVKTEPAGGDEDEDAE